MSTPRPFRYALPSSLAFTVYAATPEEADRLAEEAAQDRLADHDLNFPPDLDVWLELDGNPPSLLWGPEGFLNHAPENSKGES